MIPFNFEYYKPSSIKEAVNLFQELQVQGEIPLYFGGGTEIITLGRIGNLNTNAVIDINSIPECIELAMKDGKFILGSGISLTQAVYQDHFLLLSKCANEIADQTARNKISLGGNICSHIRFKEAILPFLITDSQVLIASDKGVQMKTIFEAFNEDFQLSPGELLVQLIVDENYINAPYFAKKIRTIGTVGYPVISINAVKISGRLKIAISGASNLPLYSEEINETLNNRQSSYKERVKLALDSWPKPIIDDIQGSEKYKRFLLETTILEIFQVLEVD
jgi:CO/xanthine dehydrogenase FAD-binding subunit